MPVTCLHKELAYFERLTLCRLSPDKFASDARSASEGQNLAEGSGSEEEAGASQDTGQGPGRDEAAPPKDSCPRDHRPQEAGHMWHGRQASKTASVSFRQGQIVKRKLSKPERPYMLHQVSLRLISAGE